MSLWRVTNLKNTLKPDLIVRSNLRDQHQDLLHYYQPLQKQLNLPVSTTESVSLDDILLNQALNYLKVLAVFFRLND